jgi:thioredoxin 1
MIVLVVVVVGFAALVILPRILMAMKTAKLKGKPAPTPHKASARRIRSGAKTILYFYTPTCHACRAQDPVVSKLQKRYPDAIFKLDATKQREAASAYGVMGVPFMAFIEGGTVVAAQAGVQREATIAGFLSGKAPA